MSHIHVTEMQPGKLYAGHPDDLVGRILYLNKPPDRLRVLEDSIYIPADSPFVFLEIANRDYGLMLFGQSQVCNTYLIKILHGENIGYMTIGTAEKFIEPSNFP